jgi:hypothetical protein
MQLCNCPKTMFSEKSGIPGSVEKGSPAFFNTVPASSRLQEHLTLRRASPQGRLTQVKAEVYPYGNAD